jgi:hypothetical protein
MRQFYTQCLGLETAISSEGYCILESDSVRLSLVAVPDEIAATISIETPPRRRANVPIKLAFDVPVIDDVRTIAASLGGQIDPQTTEWRLLGMIHCDGIDPEGNVIQLLCAEDQISASK